LRQIMLRLWLKHFKSSVTVVLYCVITKYTSLFIYMYWLLCKCKSKNVQTVREKWLEACP